ncbi:MAG: hypothetical protein IT292_01785 [Deltaproteobacteria bacterium]|nr:hypothetical protein [Deltaproteobacteria bacterium]
MKFIKTTVHEEEIDLVANLPKFSIILGITGSYALIESAILETIQTINSVSNIKLELVVIYNHPGWFQSPFHQMLPLKIKCDYRVFNADSENLASVFNYGAANARGEYLLFLWPGCHVAQTGLNTLYKAIQDNKSDLYIYPNNDILANYGVDGEYFVNNFFTHFVSSEEIIIIPQTLIRADFLKQLGGFSDSLLLGKEFQREFFLRATRSKSIEILSISNPICQVVTNLESIIEDLNLSRYATQSFAVRSGLNGTSAIEQESNFLNDIQENYFKRIVNPQSRQDAHPPPPLRIILVSGAWEYHHNKLTFYNYFKILEGSGKLTFIPRLDRVILPEKDLLNADLVIISRGRSANILKVLDYCERFNVPVLYMIDDNWFSISSDYPKLYGSLFVSGNPEYEVFLECLRRSTAVLVYNKVLEEDVKRYARKVFRLPVNILIDDFLKNDKVVLPHQVNYLLEWRQQENGTLLGYVGSARFTDVAFRALARADMDADMNVKLILFGNLLPEHRNIFKHNPITLPFTTYENYAQIMRSLNPDVLVAPLENNRTSNSKCPNKYLEYAVSGSVGVYTDIYPYNEYVRDRSTGVLVPAEATEIDWYNAIKELVINRDIRGNIACSAREDVLSQYETRKVLPEFLSMIHQVIQDNQEDSKL